MTHSPPTQRPSRIWTPVKVAAAVVVLVLLLAVVLLVVSYFRGGRDDVPQGVAPSAVATEDSSGTGSAASAAGAPVCPQNEGSQDRVVAEAPEATWRYQDLVAYPVSPQFGPAVTDDVGRFCFQHSPSGALFMAATTAAAGSAVSGDNGQAYLAQTLAEGPYREQLLSQGTPGYGGQDIRVAIAGFKVLDYTGGTATVDLGASILRNGQQFYGSSIFFLVWQDGDWKLSSNVEQPMNVSVLPDLAGYIPWGA